MSARLKACIGCTMVILVVVGMHYAGVSLGVERSLRAIVGIPSGVLYRRTVAMTAPADTDLRQEAARAHALAAEVALLSEENASLRQQLDFFAKVPSVHKGADVIGRDVEPIGNTLIINRGTSDGILIGAPVITGHGLFIGKIARADERTAIVRLVNDGQSKVAATIINRDQSIGIVEGGYGITVRMNFIPQNESVAPGDSIVTSGLEQGVPRGLLIGTVEAVEKEAYQPFQRAILSTAADLDHLTAVSVIIGL